MLRAKILKEGVDRGVALSAYYVCHANSRFCVLCQLLLLLKDTSTLLHPQLCNSADIYLGQIDYQCFSNVFCYCTACKLLYSCLQALLLHNRHL